MPGSLEQAYPLDQLWLHGIFSGLCLIMIIYNLAFYFSFRDRSYLALAGLCLVLNLYFLLADNILLTAESKIVLFGITMAFFHVFAAWSAYELLPVKKYSPLLWKLFLVAGVAGFIISISYCFAHGKLLSNIQNWEVIIWCLILIFILINTFIRGDRYEKTMSGIFFLPVIGGLIYTFRLLHYFPENFFTDSAYQISVAMMLILFSVLVSYRIITIRKSEADAREQALKKALENEKLVEEQNLILELKVSERTRELQETQEQLVQAEKLASLAQVTAGIAHEIRNPLNFVNNFSQLSEGLLDELSEGISNGDKELIDELKANLQKINHHGKRADGIVKSMLQHSRGVVNETRVNTDLNELIMDTLNNTQESAEIELPDLDCQILYKSSGELLADIYPEEFTRVLLNLFNNAIYAMNEKRMKATDNSYKPLLEVKATPENNGVNILIRDNGPGISKSALNKVFEPFFTTKPPGQGTGLGLSISYDIITKLHGGAMKVNSVEGEFTEFRIMLPLT